MKRHIHSDDDVSFVEEKVDVNHLPSSLEGRRNSSETTLRRRRLKETTDRIVYPSSLDFERIVNQYSVQAAHDRIAFDGSADGKDAGLPSAPPLPPAHGGILGGAGDELEGLVQQPISLPAGSAKYSTFEYAGAESSVPLAPPPPPRRTKAAPATANADANASYTGRAATRWFLTVLIGALTGVVSILIVKCTSTIEEWRSAKMDQLWRANHWSFTIFVVYAGTNLTLAVLSALLCLYQPQASGSGIPEVKAYLNGVRVRRFSSLSLLLVKVVGTILSVSSGLVIGPEGPLVHIGAIFGASCSKLYGLLLSVIPQGCFVHAEGKKAWSFILTDLSHFAHDSERRDLVSIGAAAGFSAAFGAPVGGLLFALEEASSYFAQSMFLKTLAATATATFCLAVHHGNLSEYSVISLGNFHTSDRNIFLNRVEEIPLYIVIAIGGGVLGGVFCQSWKMLQLLRKRFFSETRAQPRGIQSLCQVIFVSLLTSSLLYYVPLMNWTCRRVDVNDDLVEIKSVLDPWKFHPHQFDCPTGYINELATIFFGSREDAIASILSDPDQFKPRTLWSVGIVCFILMTLTLGISIPSGIFMPTFLIGSSLGGAAGVAFQRWLGQDLSPSTFALLGAAALLAGIQRSTVSLCVILVEGTGQVKVLIPVIITVVVARYVADLVCGHGLYELAMSINNYPYLEHHDDKRLDIFKVRDIMSSPPATIKPHERAGTIVKLLQGCDHHGFPVVDPHTNKFLGLVRRDQLVACLEFGVFDDGPSTQSFDGEESSTSAPTSPNWTPRPGVEKTPLMHLAYHITDDMYDHIDSNSTSQRLKNGAVDQLLVRDDYDANAWLESIRKFHKTPSAGALFREESMPLFSAIDEDTAWHGENITRQEAAVVAINDKGNVYVKDLHPNLKRKFVHVGAVMNRGTYCVNDFCPVSKAYYMFTNLGLRHLIVLGGEGGGEVVGVLTRISFMKEYIQERTRYGMRN